MHLERGASLIEMLFAMAIVALAAPFAYRQVVAIGQDTKVVSTAKNMVSELDSVKNYIRLYANNLPLNQPVQIKSDDKNKHIFVLKSEQGIDGFIVISHPDILESHKIANAIGQSAAVVEDDLTAYSSGGWAITIEDGKPGDIVLRTQAGDQSSDSEKYLHRSVLSDGDLSTMKRDLSLGGNSIVNAGAIAAKKLVANDLDSYLVKTGVISTETLYFTDGLNLNPGKSKIHNIEANGDIEGFKNIYTNDFTSKDGNITSEETKVVKTLTVNNQFQVKSDSAIAIDGFAGASANIIRCAYLDTTNLTFLPEFGLTVSNELLYSDTPPIKFGSWTFPNKTSVGPTFKSIKLTNLKDQSIVISQSDFSQILKDGWQ